MSAAGADPISSDALDRLAARLTARSAKSGPRKRPLLGPLVEAAALLDAFELDALAALPSGHPPESLGALLSACMPLADAEGRPQRWALTPDARVAALRQLREHGRLDVAIAANRDCDGPLRRALEGYIRAGAPPLGEQTLTDLTSSYPATEWLRSAGFEGLPAHDEITRRMDWLTLLEPFEYLAGRHFHGRARELAQLRAHAGVLAPGSDAPGAADTSGPGGERTPPVPGGPPGERVLVVYGPGGVGKSTLLARFILEHAKALERDRFPFAYLDVDRSAVDSTEPLTLLVEALRQFAIEYPEARERFERIAAGWSQLIADGGAPARRSSAARAFADALTSLKCADRPVVIVIDTFEEVQVRSGEDVEAIWRMLEELALAVPQLHVCVVGRSEVPGHAHRTLALGQLDEDDAIGFLRARGVTDLELARRIVRQVGGSPLSLKLAADLVEREALPDDGPELHTHESLLVRIDDRVVQRQLYRRVLGHIHDAGVRRLAHPGLVLRRLTPELIRDVLAEPCGLAISSLAEAEELFQRLRMEVSIVSVASDGALVHRPDLRVLILEQLERDEPERARRIRELAVDYYAARRPDPRERAEEIYHRIALDHEPAVIDDRWMTGVGRHLKSALLELSGRRRAFLAARIGVDVDDTTRRLADVEDWEELVARKARALLSDDFAEDALALIATRDERSARSPLVALHAIALARRGQPGEALAILDRGIEAALGAGERRHGLRLALQQAEMVIARRRRADAPSAVAWLELLTERAAPARPSTRGALGEQATGERLDALAHLIALDELLHGAAPAATGERREELRARVDAAGDDVLASEPARTPWIVSCLRGDEDAGRMARGILLAGPPTDEDGGAREIAHVITSIDVRASADAGAEPGLLARRHGVALHGSLTASWGEFMLKAEPERVAEVLASMLRSEPRGRRGVLVDTIARVVRSNREREEVGGWLGEEEPVTQPSEHRHVLAIPTRDALVEALARSFPSSQLLGEFLRDRLDLNLDAITPNLDDVRATAFDVVAYAESRGYLEPLVARALEADPGSPGFVAAARVLGVSTIVPEECTAIAVADPAAQDWHERLGAIEAQVCRIEAGRVLGAGFLVGPDLVLTADGVVDSPEHADEELVVRFDTRTGHDGTLLTAGSVFEVERVVARSGREAGTGLGYALLRIREAPGAMLIGQRSGTVGRLRRWMELSEPIAPVRAGMSFAIVHRRLGGSLTLSTSEAAVLGVSGDGTRAYHALGTVTGSAGSPCFNAGLEPVAIHVGTSHDDAGAPEGAGVAVLLAAVLADLRARGLGHLLGAVFS